METETVQLELGTASTPTKKSRSTASRANDLGGKEWTRYSISVWNDIRKTPQEAKLGHPAMFPGALVHRILRCFTRDGDSLVVDPFCGSGATLVAARALGKTAVGFEVAKEYYDLARERLRQVPMLDGGKDNNSRVYLCDSRTMSKYVRPQSVDICITSPPYWDILSRKRSADSKPVRDYAGGECDLSRLNDYGQFLDALADVFREVYRALKKRQYCVVVVMDIRKQERFYPFHADLAQRLSRDDVGFFLDDIIIWDRRQEYNNLRPLGYPSTFRINKIHEYILVFRKPK